jgi:hypothetical protein
MVKGYPDWRPPSAPGTYDLTQINVAAIGDIVASPAAGFRLVLYSILVVTSAAVQTICVAAEVTPANVTVRRVLVGNLLANTGTLGFSYNGVPFGATNKLRLITAPGGGLEFHVLTRTEAV